MSEELFCRWRCLKRCSSSGSIGPRVHAVCVMDRGGKSWPQFTIAHTADGIAGLIRRLAIRRPAEMPDRDRTPERAAGRSAARSRAPGRTGHPERDQDLARRRSALRRQIRRRRRRRDRRIPAAASAPSCGSPPRTPARPRRCGLWSAPAMTWSSMRVAATNQLSALLDAHWPGAKADLRRCRIADQPGVPDPLPDRDARGPLRRETAGRVPCQATATPASRTAAELLARLRGAPAGTTVRRDRGRARRRAGPGRRAQRSTPRSRISTARSPPASRSTRTAKIFTSLPRSGQINAAQVLAEWGDCRASLRRPRRRRRPGRLHPGHQSIR